MLRLRLCKRPPSDVEPVFIEQDDNVKPVEAAHRRYPSPKRGFMDCLVSKGMDFEFMERSIDEEWTSALHIVSKTLQAKFRLAFDLRAINGINKPVHWPMPNIGAELCDLLHSRFFLSIFELLDVLLICSGFFVNKTSKYHCLEALSFRKN